MLTAIVAGGAALLFWWSPWSGQPQRADASGAGREPVAQNDRPAPASGVGLAATNALNSRTSDASTLTMGDRAPSQRTPEPQPNRAVREEAPATTARDAQAQPGDRSSRAQESQQPTQQAVQPPQKTPVLPAPVSAPVEGRTGSPDDIRGLIARGVASQDQGRLVEARGLLNRALVDPRTSATDRALIRERMAVLNQTLVFSPTVIEGDPLAEAYVIRAGDSLSKIAAAHDLKIDWRFLQRVNRISDPRRIRVGQTIKLIRGPFHAVISKSEYRLDLYADMPTSAGGGRVFIASYPVGLGEYSSTPTGAWVVRKDSRLINPPWTNPRTGESFSADNPENPIGERWVGLEGVDDTTRQISGIGIHGTIEPQTIGTDASMGCVRMLDADVEVVYELLTEGGATVEIAP